MYRRSILRSFCLVLLALVGNSLGGQEPDNDAASDSTWVTSIAQLGDTDEFVAATADGLLLREAKVYSFNAANPDQRTEIYSHPAAVWCVTATSGGSRIASVDYRGNLVVFDRATSEKKLHEKGLERWCQAMIVSPDDRSVIAGNDAGKIMVFQIDAEKVVKSQELDGHAVTGLALSPDGSTLAASDGGGHVHLLKWPSLEAIGKIDISDDSAWCVVFVDGGSHLLVGSSDRKLYRCEVKPEAKPEVIAKGTDWITQLAVSPSGLVAAAEVGGRLHFPTSGGTDSMDAQSGVWSLCWNGDGQLFAGTRKDGIVSAGRSWKWTEPAKPAEEKADEPDADEPDADDSDADDSDAGEEPDEDGEKENKSQEVEEKSDAAEKPPEDNETKE